MSSGGFQFLYWAVAFVILCVAAVIMGEKRRAEGRRKAEATEATVRTRRDFAPSDVYLSVQDQSGIAIDLENNKLMILRARAQHIIGFKQLISVELVEDNVSLVKTSRGSQLAGVIVGGVLAGGVGAVIGGLSGSKRSSETVRKISLQIVTDDFNKPNHEVTFLDWLLNFDPSLKVDLANSGKGLSKDDPLYKEALEKANLWHSRLTTIMKRVSCGP